MLSLLYDGRRLISPLECVVARIGCEAFYIGYNISHRGCDTFYVEWGIVNNGFETYFTGWGISNIRGLISYMGIIISMMTSYRYLILAFNFIRRESREIILGGVVIKERGRVEHLGVLKSF